MRIRILALSLAILGAVATSARAAFHARLVKAEPALDATVTEKPSQVRLWFNEAPDAKLSSGTLTSADSTINVKLVFGTTDNPNSVTSPLEAELTPGAYTVRWRTVSKDGHGIRGTYQFTFQP